MHTQNLLPEVINTFNVYKGGTKQIGISAEVTLPDFSALTESIEGAGILGSYDTAIVGHYGSIKQEIPFRMLFDDTYDFANPAVQQELTLRASLQSTVKTTGALDFTGMRYVVRGRAIDFKPGSIKQGGQMGASVTIECTYILFEIDGKSKLEIDKINNVFKVNGVDLLEKVKKQC